MLTADFDYHLPPELIASEPTVEDIDSFLGKYDALMIQPMVLH